MIFFKFLRFEFDFWSFLVLRFMYLLNNISLIFCLVAAFCDYSGVGSLHALRGLCSRDQKANSQNER